MAAGKGPLRIAIEDFLSTFNLGEILHNWFVFWGEKQEDAILDAHLDSLSEIGEIEGVPDVLKALATRGGGGGLQGGIASALGFATAIGMSAASAFLAPVMRLINYNMDAKLRTARLDPATAWQVARRTPELAAAAIDGLAELGYSDDLISAIRILTEPLLGEEELISLWLRGEIDDTSLDAELAKRGWTDERIAYIKASRQIIPSPGDLIQMAVREAFDDAVAAQFGYDDAYPSEAGEWAEKHGLSQDWMRKYWRAHWVLPSVGQAFEMYQRLRPGTTNVPFGADELELLLRALDIPSFWRERLTEIAYRPLTRVDVRRMYGTGTLSADDVYEAFLDFGYSPENAELMTDFTVKYESGAEKEIGRSAIVKGYKKGLLSESEATSALVDIGHTQDSADFYVSIASMELAEAQIDTEIDYVKILYIAGEISDSEVYDHLGPLDIPTEQLEKLINQWAIAKRRKIRLPSESELETWYKLGIINQEDYRSGLVERNYKAESIDYYIIQADMAIADAADAKLAAEAAEQKRIEDAEEINLYRLEIATRNVAIAEHNADIASITLAAHDIEDPLMLSDMSRAIDTLKLEIKNQLLAKTQATLDRME